MSPKVGVTPVPTASIWHLASFNHQQTKPHFLEKISSCICILIDPHKFFGFIHHFPRWNNMFRAIPDPIYAPEQRLCLARPATPASPSGTSPAPELVRKIENINTSCREIIYKFVISKYVFIIYIYIYLFIYIYCIFLRNLYIHAYVYNYISKDKTMILFVYIIILIHRPTKTLVIDLFLANLPAPNSWQRRH